MEKYFFIYKDSMEIWCEAKNPKFIASHIKCRAIEKEVLLKRFNNILQFLNKANDYFSDEKAESFIAETVLSEIE